jgi:hypothetical protein
MTETYIGYATIESSSFRNSDGTPFIDELIQSNMYTDPNTINTSPVADLSMVLWSFPLLHCRLEIQDL